MLKSQKILRAKQSISMMFAFLLVSIMLLLPACLPPDQIPAGETPQIDPVFRENISLNSSTTRQSFTLRSATPFRSTQVIASKPDTLPSSQIGNPDPIINAVPSAVISATKTSDWTATITIPLVTDDGNMYYFPTESGFQRTSTATWMVRYNTAVPTWTHGPTLTRTSTFTAKPSLTRRDTRTPTPTLTHSPTYTASPTASATQTWAPSPTLTPTETWTPSVTSSPAETPTPTATVSTTASETPTQLSGNTPEPTSTNTPGSMMPGNGSFVFVSSIESNTADEIFLIELPDLTTRKIMDLDNGQLCNWSPDGSTLLVQTNRGESNITDLQLVSLDGTSTTLTGLLSGSSRCGAWRIDGTAILFPYTDTDGLTSLIEWVLMTNEIRPLFSDGSQIIDPDISHNGKWLVFVSQTDTTQDLLLLDLENQSVSRLTDTEESESVPRFSNDDQTIAFSRQVDQQWKLFTIDRRSLGETCLTTSVANELWPDWSPDGQYLLFTSDVSGAFNIHLLRIGDAAPYQLLPSDSIQNQPLWQP